MDVEQLEQLSQLPGRTGPRLLDEILTQFIESMPGELIYLRKLAVQKATDDFTMLSHSIAATCASLGSRAMRATALKMETAGRAGQWSEVEKLLAQFDGQWLETKNALQKYAAAGLVPVSGA